MLLPLDEVKLILPANQERGRAYITVVSDATIWFAKDEMELGEYEDHLGFPLKINIVHEINGYKGTIYAVSDTLNADVRVIEYPEVLI